MPPKPGASSTRTLKPGEKRALVKAATTDSTGALRSHDNAKAASAVKGKGAITAHVDTPPQSLPQSQDTPNNSRPLSDFPDLCDVLPDLAEEYRVLCDRMKVDESRKKELSKDIEPLLVAVGHDSIEGDGWVVVRSKGRSPKSLSPEKLMEAGVSIETLAECTVLGTPYTYIQVRKLKAKE